MSVQLLNPETLPTPETWHQVALASGSRMVFTAGQTAGRTEDGTPIGGADLAAQAEQAYVNVGAALAAAGASFDDVTKLNVYVADWSPEKMESLVAGVLKAAERLGADVVKPNTLIGVASLFEPDFLIEVEAVAVLP